MFVIASRSFAQSAQGMRAGTHVSGFGQCCVIGACHSAWYIIGAHFVALELMYKVNVSTESCQVKY